MTKIVAINIRRGVTLSALKEPIGSILYSSKRMDPIVICLSDKSLQDDERGEGVKGLTA
jgi:hypothetical protein